MDVDYRERIPNNVNLSDNRRLQRALESWQPNFLNWWQDMGPTDFQDFEIYLRTAISVEANGWSNFGHVKMPDYRWGIFLSHGQADRTVGFGEHMGEAAWQEVPGEYRGVLRRLIVTQGDTEPASVEQQRQLGFTAPSLYDMRNLFQINVEEGRHLWAMVYLLHAYFGRDGREEAEALLERHSGDADKPRILGAFNEATPDWLSLFMFTYFTDRDGKYQLASLAESGFDPLSRTCRFMLTEEAHHMFVGETGIGRVVQRACEIMTEYDTDDVRKYGGIDLGTIQKYLNFHFSVSLDLFGSEISTNAANYYSMGLKGRYKENKISDDHQLGNSIYPIVELVGDKFITTEKNGLTAVNERLRDDYIEDCSRGINRWNEMIKRYGISQKLKLPHRAFQRQIGSFAPENLNGMKVTPFGTLISIGSWEEQKHNWLPTDSDESYIKSLMQQVTKPGKFANWIAPPTRGIHGQAKDFDYVRID